MRREDFKILWVDTASHVRYFDSLIEGLSGLGFNISLIYGNKYDMESILRESIDKQVVIIHVGSIDIRFTSVELNQLSERFSHTRRNVAPTVIIYCDKRLVAKFSLNWATELNNKIIMVDYRMDLGFDEPEDVFIGNFEKLLQRVINEHETTS